ncbi:MFS transporter [Actinophytocola sp.]|uniref:MFS transporter n=1 Tax=Actinophytocola sp. TaxID=1872138 RepID=UPI003D6A4B7E
MTILLPSVRRSTVFLFGGVAAMNTAMVGASTAATLIVSADAGPAWSGLPNAFVITGTALGTLGAGAVMARRGSRPVLLAMYAAAVAGGLIAFGAAAGALLAPLLTGMVLLGLGNGVAQMSRYLAAELYPAHRKGFALSVIVWAGTVGAIAGPVLIAPGARIAGLLGVRELAGPALVSAAIAGLALAASAGLPRVPPPPARPRLSLPMVATALRRPEVLTPLVAMVGAQVSMVAVMTMTPLQLDHHGQGLDVIGLILSAHMIGMFALAPLSGRIADLWGGRVAIYLGIGTLAVAATTAVAAPTAHTSGLPAALFLLGYGWNLVFVGGSSLLSRDLPADERTQLQGGVDAVVWLSSAVASLAAGVLYGLGGFALVAVVGGALALAPIALVGRRR